MNDELDWGDSEDLFARWDEVTPVPWFCAACGSPNSTLLDLGGGFRQMYTEDCEVCCRPNLLRIMVDEATLAVAIENELEYD